MALSTQHGEMKKLLIGATCLIALAGCQTDAKEATGSFELKNSYQAAADCALVELRKEAPSMWSKDDLPSQNRSLLTFAYKHNTGGRLNFVSTGPNTTRVDVHFAQRFYTERFKKVLEICSMPQQA